MIDLKQPFPFFLNSDRQNFALIAGVSAFTYFFLLVFQPFGTDSATPEQEIRYVGVCFAVMFFNLLLLPRMAENWFDSCQWTLGKYLIFNFYNLVAISVVITLTNKFAGYHDQQSFARLLVYDLSHVTLLGIIPLVLVTFMLRNRMLLQMVQSGNAATDQLTQFHVGKAPADPELLTIQSDTSEVLDLSLDKFLYAVADNNYSELFFSTSSGVSSRLMRMTLKSLEAQLPASAVLRCHRSYLVHLGKVMSVNGNANGYRLGLEGVEEEIPVSRALGKEVLERINHLAATA